MQQQTCPQCGRPVIEVKDWGRAGTLYVHSKGVARRKGVAQPIPVQEACHVHATKG